MAMTSNQRNWATFLGATAVTAAAAGAYLATAGATDDNIRLTLRLSAHAAFVLLLVVFVARPLRQLLRSPMTLALLKNRRLMGIAFAGIHTAHLGLIFFRARQIADFDLNIAESVGGVAIYLLIYLMFLTSFDATARALGPRNWRILHKVGLYVVLLAFIPTLLPESSEQLTFGRSLLLVLAAIAFVLRLTAYLAKRKGT